MAARQAGGASRGAVIGVAVFALIAVVVVGVTAMLNANYGMTMILLGAALFAVCGAVIGIVVRRS